MIKKFILILLRKLGYELLKTNSLTHDNNKHNKIYSKIESFSKYSPWNSDLEFQDLFQKIKNYSLVDKYRMYELWSFAKQYDKTEGSILEVGVWRGGTGCLLAKAAPKSKVYLADTFKGVVKSKDIDKFYKDGEHDDTNRGVVESLINILNIKNSNVEILEGIFPDETGHLIPFNESFKLIHIDVDVYQSAKDIVEWIWNKLIIGGIIIFDDYGFETCYGITKYVNELFYLTDNISIYNINGHAILVKTK